MTRNVTVAKAMLLVLAFSLVLLLATCVPDDAETGKGGAQRSVPLEQLDDEGDVLTPGEAPGG